MPLADGAEWIMRPRFALCLLLGILFFQNQAEPQQITASLGGRVKDPSGAAIPGAKVTVRNTATNYDITLQTSSEGAFLAPALQPGGPYEVTVEAAGFKKVHQGGITLQVDQSARLELVMEIGAVAETIEVSGSATLLETVSSSGGQVVDNRSIINLPLNQRNPYMLVMLVPGVNGNIGFQYNSVNFSVNGGRPGSNEILLDGIPSSPPLVNSIQGFAVFPSVEAVLEFKVQSNNYSAEFGRSGGSVVNLIFRSGTNELHGSLFEFLRNSRLDANNFFANNRGIPLGSFKRNQFGASLGGPVYLPKLYNGRNRTFFYFTYEGLRQRSAANLLTTVPTALQRAGDFSQTRNAAGALLTIYDPATTIQSGAAFSRQPFAGNRAPSGRIDPVAANVVKYYPLPNGAGDPNTGRNNYASSGSNLTDINQVDIKVDENLNDSNRFFLRISRRNINIGAPDYFPPDVKIAQGGLSQPEYGSGAAFDYTWTVRPSFLMSFRYGFGRTLLAYRPRSDGFDPTKLGLPEYINRQADRIMFPGFGPDGYFALGNGGPQWRRNSFETHNVTWNNAKVTSAHHVRFGFEGRLLHVNNTEAGNSAGNFTFSRSFTQGPDPTRASNTAGDGMASFLLGIGTGTLTKGFQGSSNQSYFYAWYVADDWKVTRKLTLNIGLRYELEIPRTERFNRLTTFDPLVASPLAGPSGIRDLRGGLVYVAADGRGRRQFPNDTNNWAPRFGLAYQLSKSTVIRSAYGIFFAPSPTAASGGSAYGYRTDTTFIGSQDGLRPYHYLRDPFPEGFAPIVGNSLGLLSSVGGDIASPLRDTVVPYMQNWNLDIQRELPGDILLDVTYVGTRGLQLSESRALNQIRPELLAGGSKLLERVGNPFVGLIRSGPLSTPTVPQYFLLRPFPQFTDIGVPRASGASSTYHGFQLKAEKRFSKGLSFLLSYTSSKLIDDYSIIAVAGRNSERQNTYDRRAERSISSNEVSQRLVLSYVYDLPFGRGRSFGAGWNRVADSLLGGWQINGITTLQTGQPLIITAQDTSFSGGAAFRANNNGRSAKLSSPVHGRLDRYFDTSVFSQPAPFTLGNVGRTLPDVRGPGTTNHDFSLFKNFRAREWMTVQFRGEFFNLFNTPAFGFPDQNANSVQFGRITSQANAPRQVQFGLKLLF